MALLGRKRPPADLNPPQTLTEAEAALRAIDAERTTLRAEIARLAAREADLLQTDAEDTAFDELDAAKARAERSLARLDLREKRLLDLARDLHGAEQRARFVDLVDRYQTALARWVDAHRASADARLDLVDLRAEASRVGLERYVPQLPLPSFNLPATHEAVDQFVRCAPSEMAALRAPGTEGTVFQVRFRRPAQLQGASGRAGYRAGEIAAFSAGDALAFVRSGAAEWVGQPALQEEAE